MAQSTKLVTFFQKIDGKILYGWKETITHNETIRKRLEEALKKDIEEHEKNKKVYK